MAVDIKKLSETTLLTGVFQVRVTEISDDGTGTGQKIRALRVYSESQELPVFELQLKASTEDAIRIITPEIIKF